MSDLDFQRLHRVPTHSEEGGLRPEVHCALSGTHLEASFRLVGGTPDSVLGLTDDPDLGERRDELWKSTCFEVFFASQKAGGYGELNLSPSGDWASYAFDSVRTGMRPAEATVESLRRAGDVWHYIIDLERSPDFLFPCTVLEDARGVTYWSARPGAPERVDFHADFWDAWTARRSS